jgi:hypothetical protein
MSGSLRFLVDKPFADLEEALVTAEVLRTTSPVETDLPSDLRVTVRWDDVPAAKAKAILPTLPLVEKPSILYLYARILLSDLDELQQEPVDIEAECASFCDPALRAMCAAALGANELLEASTDRSWRDVPCGENGVRLFLNEVPQGKTLTPGRFHLVVCVNYHAVDDAGVRFWELAARAEETALLRALSEVAGAPLRTMA